MANTLETSREYADMKAGFKVNYESLIKGLTEGEVYEIPVMIEHKPEPKSGHESEARKGVLGLFDD
jgi:hypothetical protein